MEQVRGLRLENGFKDALARFRKCYETRRVGFTDVKPTSIHKELRPAVVADFSEIPTEIPSGIGVPLTA